LRIPITLLLINDARKYANTSKPSRAPLMRLSNCPRLHLEPLNLLNFDFNADRIMLFTTMRIRIKLPKIMWIRIRYPGERTELEQRSAGRGSSHRRNIATGPTNDIIWLYRSPIPVGRTRSCLARGDFFSTCLCGGWGGGGEGRGEINNKSRVQILKL
jgi:hypothetical protein